MVIIRYAWDKSKGLDIMTVKPLAPVNGENWVEFFKSNLENFNKDNFFLIADLVGVEENITAEEFSHMADQFIHLGITKVRIVVLTLNSEYLKLGKLFESMAELKKLDLTVNFLKNEDEAINWFKTQ